jgi:hypothetical protein
MTIWKYQLGRRSVCQFSIPAGAQFLGVQIQDGVPTTWAIFDPRGTGHDVPAFDGELKHIGTVIDGQFVWHYFAEIVRDA